MPLKRRNTTLIIVKTLLITLLLISLFACSGDGCGDDGICGTGLVEGSANKGPFARNSLVTVSVNRGLDWIPTRTSETKDDLGRFSFNHEKNTLIEIAIKGFHYNELTGNLSSGEITLKNVYFVSPDSKQAVYVNLLTHLIHGRVTKLIVENKMNHAAAINQAQNELISELGAVLQPPDPVDFSHVGVFNFPGTDKAGNAYLLALSAILYRTATAYAEKAGNSVDAQLSDMLAKLADDIADNGNIDQYSAILEDMAQARLLVDAGAVVLNMIALKDGIEPGLTVPDIAEYFDKNSPAGPPGDYDKDGILNLVDPHPFEFEIITSNLEAVTAVGTPVPLNLKFNQPTDQTVVFKPVTAPRNGVFEGDPLSLIYKPNPGFFGTEIIDYVLSTGSVNSNLASLKITVTPAGDAGLLVYVNPPQAVSQLDFSYTPQIHNPNNLLLNFQLLNQPQWLQVDSSSGRLSGLAGAPGPAGNIQFQVYGGTTLLDTKTFQLDILPYPWVEHNAPPFGALPGTTVAMYDRKQIPDVITVIHALQPPGFEPSQKIWRYNRIKRIWDPQVHNGFLPPGPVHACQPFLVHHDTGKNLDRFYLMHGTELFWEFYSEPAGNFTHCATSGQQLYRFNEGISKHYDFQNRAYTQYNVAGIKNLIAALNVDGNIVLFTWTGDSGGNINSVQLLLYDKSTHNVTTYALAPLFHKDFTPIYLSGKFFLLGGGNHIPMYYDITEKKWYRSQIPMIRPIDSPAVVDDGGKLLLLGGTLNKEQQSIFLEYDPAMDTFNAVP